VGMVGRVLMGGARYDTLTWKRMERAGLGSSLTGVRMGLGFTCDSKVKVWDAGEVVYWYG